MITASVTVGTTGAGAEIFPATAIASAAPGPPWTRATPGRTSAGWCAAQLIMVARQLTGSAPAVLPIMRAAVRAAGDPPAQHDRAPRAGKPEKPRRPEAAESPDDDQDERDCEPGTPGGAPGRGEPAVLPRHPALIAQRCQRGTRAGQRAAAARQARVRQPVQVNRRQVGEQLVKVADRLCRPRAVKPLVELLGVQPSCRVVLAQQRRRPVPIVVGGPDPGIGRHRVPPQLFSVVRTGAGSDSNCPAQKAAKPAAPPSSAVSTQGPSAVMATVCSKCAAGPPSALTTVQSSSSSRVCGRPSTSMGSIARAIPSVSNGPRPGLP